jgi:hypothetical protein
LTNATNVLDFGKPLVVAAIYVTGRHRMAETPGRLGAVLRLPRGPEGDKPKNIG